MFDLYCFFIIIYINYSNLTEGMAYIAQKFILSLCHNYTGAVPSPK